MFKYMTITFTLLALTLSTTVSAAPVVFSVGGSNLTTSIQSTVDAFRAALGNPNNGNAAGPLSSGRREINWDGGGSTANSPAGTPFNGFQNTRGAQFTTPGTGFMQAPASGGTNGGLATFFGNATYGTTFNFFSPVRLFVPVGSNVTDAVFSIPGTSGGTPASVGGFGAVFTDVDLASSSLLEFFDLSGNSLGSFNAPAGTVTDGSLSFLGVTFTAGERIGRVRITNGNTALGPNDNPSGGVDIVALDDFLFDEPQVVPEPSTWALFGVGAMALVALQRSRRTRRL